MIATSSELGYQRPLPHFTSLLPTEQKGLFKTHPPLSAYNPLWARHLNESQYSLPGLVASRFLSNLNSDPPPPAQYAPPRLTLWSSRKEPRAHSGPRAFARDVDSAFGSSLRPSGPDFQVSGRSPPQRLSLLKAQSLRVAVRICLLLPNTVSFCFCSCLSAVTRVLQKNARSAMRQGPSFSFLAPG